MFKLLLYINGEDYTGLDGWSNTELEDAMPDDVETDHNFILKLKEIMKSIKKSCLKCFWIKNASFDHQPH